MRGWCKGATRYSLKIVVKFFQIITGCTSYRKHNFIYFMNEFYLTQNKENSRQWQISSALPTTRSTLLFGYLVCVSTGCRVRIAVRCRQQVCCVCIRKYDMWWCVFHVCARTNKVLHEGVQYFYSAQRLEYK